MISYSDTKVPVLVVMECKYASVVYVYEMILSLYTSRSTEYMNFLAVNRVLKLESANIIH